MSYKLEFNEAALKEWKKLAPSLKAQFRNPLAKPLENPHVPSARLSGAEMKNAHKIKLRNADYRLVYEIKDTAITVLVLAVGKRNKNEVYEVASSRK